MRSLNQKFEKLFVCPLANDGCEIVEHRIQIKLRFFNSQLARFDLGKIQNVIDQAQQGLPGSVDLAQIVMLPTRVLALEPKM